MSDLPVSCPALARTPLTHLRAPLRKSARGFTMLQRRSSESSDDTEARAVFSKIERYGAPREARGFFRRWASRRSLQKQSLTDDGEPTGLTDTVEHRQDCAQHQQHRAAVRLVLGATGFTERHPRANHRETQIRGAAMVWVQIRGANRQAVGNAGSGDARDEVRGTGTGRRQIRADGRGGRRRNPGLFGVRERGKTGHNQRWTEKVR
jgi:hypothetical protein